jgi:hypothetical protein
MSRHRGPKPTPAPEDDGAILRFFYQLSNKLVEAAARVTEIIDTECRELLGMAGTRILSNLQCLHLDLDLLDVLQRREIAPRYSGPPSDRQSSVPGHGPPTSTGNLLLHGHIVGRKTGELLQRRSDELRGVRG